MRRFPLSFVLFCLYFTVSGQANQNIANWNFSSNVNPSTANGGSSNTSTISVAGAGTFGVAVGCGCTGQNGNFANTNTWNAGGGYWQTTVSTINFNTITVSSKQRSSSNGPNAFKLQYSTDGTTFTDVAGGAVSVANDFTTGVLTNLALPPDAAHKTALTIRWLMVGTVSVSGASGGVTPAGTSAIDDIFITGFGQLPVSLASFSGKYADNAVSLTWQTASETNNDRFEIERSGDAKSFERIGSIAGKGTSTQRNDYVFVDENAFGETAYYRLKQVDNDGQFEYSRTISVALGKETIVAYPNPANEKIWVSGDVSGLTLMDASGRTLRESSNNEIGLSGLDSGVFMLKIQETSGTERTRKVVKQ